MSHTREKNTSLKIAVGLTLAGLLGILVAIIHFNADIHTIDNLSTTKTPRASIEPKTSLVSIINKLPSGPNAQRLFCRSNSEWKVQSATHRQILRPIYSIPKHEPKDPLAITPKPLRFAKVFIKGLTDTTKLRVFATSGEERPLGVRLSSNGIELTFERLGDDELKNIATEDEAYELYYPCEEQSELAHLKPVEQMAVDYSAWDFKTTAPDNFRAIAQALKDKPPLIELQKNTIFDSLGPKGLSKNFIVRYSGWLVVPKTDKYQIRMDCHDRGILYLDGTQVMAANGVSDFKNEIPTKSLALKRGLHWAVFYHIQKSGPLRAQIFWHNLSDNIYERLAPKDWTNTHIFSAHALELKKSKAPEVLIAARPVEWSKTNSSTKMTTWQLTAYGPGSKPFTPHKEMPPPTIRYGEKNDFIVIEAERMSGQNQNGDSGSWIEQRLEEGFTGKGYLQAKGRNRASDWKKAAELTYNIEVEEAGEYHFAYRYLAPNSNSNSVWSGLDERDLSRSVGLHLRVAPTWHWHRSEQPITLLAGKQVFSLRRRESNLLIDRIIIAKDITKLPEHTSTLLGPDSTEIIIPPSKLPSPSGKSFVWLEGEEVIGQKRVLNIQTSSMPSLKTGTLDERTLQVLLLDGKKIIGQDSVTLSFQDTHELNYRLRTLELKLSCDELIYDHEKARIKIIASNKSARPVTLELLEHRFFTGGEIKTEQMAEFPLPAMLNNKKDVTEKRLFRQERNITPKARRELKGISYTLGSPGAPELRADVKLINSRNSVWPQLVARTGQLLVRDAEQMAEMDALALINLPYDDEDAIRRWSLVTGFAPNAQNNDAILFYGDNLASSGAEGGEGILYQMKKVMPQKKFVHSPQPKGEWPILAMLAGINKALGEDNYGSVIISLGNADFNSRTPVRLFKRTVDAMIDRLWQAPSRPNIYILSPIGTPQEAQAMRPYIDGLNKIATRHGVEFVNLNAITKKLSPDFTAWREKPTDISSFPYPLAKFRDELAERVLEVIE